MVMLANSNKKYNNFQCLWLCVFCFSVNLYHGGGVGSSSVDNKACFLRYFNAWLYIVYSCI